MTLSYSGALAKITDAAQLQRKFNSDSHEPVPLTGAVGRSAARDILSPKSLPEHDTSAMDGYAVYAHTTTSASPQTPVLLRVEGYIAAGENPKAIQVDMADGEAASPCVEIMTGAIFPDGPLGRPYDACIKVEDTQLATPPTPPGDWSTRHILITKPVASGMNKRFAKSDISEGDVIVRKGDVTQLSHVLPLASLGLESVPAMRRPRVGIFSTGLELMNGNGATGDANGPYLTAAARDIGVEADFLGILDDDERDVHRCLQKAGESGLYDILLTSGGVSKGKVDHVPNVLLQLGADIVFHGLSIRPGHPVLFARVPTRMGRVSFFGLPGNPGAAAACFRFLTMPYIRALQGQEQEQPVPATLGRLQGCKASQKSDRVATMDCFRHGVLSVTSGGTLAVEPSREQSPAKLGPFASANCWIHFKNGSLEREGDVVDCYPLSPTGLQLSPTS